MPEALLAGTNVLDLADDPGARAARILGDLGAEVIRAVPLEGDPLETRPAVSEAWNAGKRVVRLAPSDPALQELLAGADVVIATPYAPGFHHPDPTTSTHAVWMAITPFGLDGPHSQRLATDLGVMAASGNMYCTGHPDRAPIRCTEPTSYCHTGGEAAFAALSALASGRRGIVDVSMHEVTLVANMAGQYLYPVTGQRGTRRGAQIGRSREIWPTRDGWVSFGLRGGKARVPTLELLTRLCVEEKVPGAEALAGRDWVAYNPNTVTDEELRAIEAPTAEYFARHTMQELFDIACENNWMLAPAMSPREISQSRQLEARGFLKPLDGVEQFPTSFVVASDAEGHAASVAPRGAARVVDANEARFYGRGFDSSTATNPLEPAWAGLRLLEFGSGAAGPIASRYYAEHGATVVRVESVSRPDFLRVYALGPRNPHGLEGSALYDTLNPGKRDVTLNLKAPEALELVRRLVAEWADAVTENFAPRAMKGFGLDYESLLAVRPDLVMISACLNGQTGPFKDYPGFGSQGAALSGFNHLTGWPDREPVGPHGTITDSLAPRYVATALAAGLLYRRRTGRGVHLDLSQVEVGIWSLSPWIVEYSQSGKIGSRLGNRSEHAVPHGAFPCADEGELSDRWVAIACHDDAQWQRLAETMGLVASDLDRFENRKKRVDEVEAAVADWTRARSRDDVTNTLQAAGIEAVPVADLGDVTGDPQLAHRGHWLPGRHPVMGERVYERNGFRLPDDCGDYERRHSPLLGQDNDWVLSEVLGLDEAEIKELVASGAVEQPPD